MKKVKLYFICVLFAVLLLNIVSWLDNWLEYKPFVWLPALNDIQYIFSHGDRGDILKVFVIMALYFIVFPLAFVKTFKK